MPIVNSHMNDSCNRSQQFRAISCDPYLHKCVLCLPRQGTERMLHTALINGEFVPVSRKLSIESSWPLVKGGLRKAVD